MEKVFTFGKMAPSTLANGLKMRLMVSVCLSRRMDDFIRANGKMEICMDMAFIFGAIRKNTKDNILTIKKQVMEFTPGLMEESIRVTGCKGNSMDLLYTLTIPTIKNHSRQAQQNMADGKMDVV